jgi:hypothetical protein
MLRRFIAIVLIFGLSSLQPSMAGAANAIEQIVPKNLTPDPGSTTTFQIAVTPDDNTVWDAGSYTITLIAADPSGTTVVTSAPFAGDQPATPQQTTMIFVDLTLPGGYVGPASS